MTFDPSLVEIFLPLLSGGTLVIVPVDSKLFPNKLFNAIQHNCNVCFMTPSLFLLFSEPQVIKILSGGTSIQHLFLGGEVFPSSLLRYGIEIGLWNIYGTTECSVWASAHKCDTAIKYHSGVPIGEFFPNTDAQIIVHKAEDGLCIISK